MEKSLAQIVAELPEDERNAALADIDPDELLYDWRFWGRKSQFAPPGDWNVWVICAGRGFGKQLEVSTIIPTPSGSTPIGKLELGDEVFAHDGTISRVTKIQDYDADDAYRVTFDDGSYIDAGRFHEWNVFRGKTRDYYAAERDLRKHHTDWWEWSYQPRNSGRKHIRVPNEILTRAKELRVDGLSWRAVESRLKTEFPSARPSEISRKRVKATVEGRAPEDSDVYRYNARTSLLVETHELQVGDAIPVAEPLDLPDAELPVDPYVFGLWIGDGSTREGSICGAPTDLVEYADYLNARGLYADHRLLHMDAGCGSLASLSLTRGLQSLGFANYRRAVDKVDKYVPDIYLRASAAQRLELLRGMMDTDGTVDKQGIHAGVGFVNKRLADAAYELVVSLGMIARRRTRTLRATDHLPERLFHVVEFRPTPDLNPFRLSRKANRVREIPRDQASRKTMRRISSIEPIGVRQTRCISIDHRSQLFLAGEAMIPTHNSRAGAEWVRDYVREHPGCRIALVGRTSADVNSVMIDGDSGIMNISPPSEKPEHQISKRRLVWPNGSIAEKFSSEEPDQLRGPQFHAAWADETAAWKFIRDASGLNAFDNLRLATRLGRHPKIVATTTPKRTPFMKDILAEAAATPDVVVVTRGSTYENAGNLSSAYLDVITGVYEGTSLAQQELMGEMLDDFEGALFDDDMIDHVNAVSSDLPLRVVAVDPSVAENPTDECGIVVVGASNEKQLHRRQAWVLEDATVHGSPEVWVKAVIAAAKKWNAPVIAEKNQGHALIDLAIRNVDPSIKVYAVHSKVGKKLRAEPVAMVYEQGRVHHLGYLAELEAQMTGWLPEVSKKSPDRLDALVHGVTALLIAPPKGFSGGTLRAHSAAGRQIAGVKSRARSAGARGLQW